MFNVLLCSNAGKTAQPSLLQSAEQQVVNYNHFDHTPSCEGGNNL